MSKLYIMSCDPSDEGSLVTLLDETATHFYVEYADGVVVTAPKNGYLAYQLRPLTVEDRETLLLDKEDAEAELNAAANKISMLTEALEELEQL